MVSPTTTRLDTEQIVQHRNDEVVMQVLFGVTNHERHDGQSVRSVAAEVTAS